MSIDFHLQDHVATVTINRPDRRNAIDSEHHRLLVKTWERIEADDDVRVVVLTGAGDHAFCAGADIHEQQPEGTDFWSSRDPDGAGGLTFRTSLTKPVIAKVNGFALGGGFELVLGCDLAVAAEHVRIGLVEPRIGRLAIDGGITSAIRHVPRKHAMELLLTGDMFDAHRAAAMGFLNQVVPADQLDRTVARYVELMLSCAPSSLSAIKAMISQTEHLTAREANLADLPAVRSQMTSADSVEGPLAFREKRKPNWSGR